MEVALTGLTLSGTVDLPDPASAPGEFAGWRLRRSTNQAIPSGADTPIVFDTARFDTHGFFAQNSIVIPEGMGGVYLMGGGFRFANVGNASLVACTITRNRDIPVGELASQGQPGGNGVHRLLNVTDMFSLEDGDLVELYAFQNTGSTVALEAIQSYTPEFWGYRVGAI